MENREFSLILEKRTRDFAVRIIRLSAKLPSTPEFNVLRNQITKSGTSIGANYREANRAKSRADFTNKIRISEGEASETTYWLEIISEFWGNNVEEINESLKEGNELLSIFTSISSNLRTRSKS
jgi:four helix bundle protein